MIKYLIVLLLITSNTFATTPEYCRSKIILHRVEQMTVEDSLPLEAKIDTGADMTSLSATHIQYYSSDNKEWAQFTIYNPKTKHSLQLTKPIIKFITIRASKDEMVGCHRKNFPARPVVMIKVSYANQQFDIMTNLIDRSNFQYPLLIGVNALKMLNALVDVN